MIATNVNDIGSLDDGSSGDENETLQLLPFGITKE
jgi:hypothetical protein